MVNADGSGKMKLSRGDVQERWPAWSPDGQRLLFQTIKGDQWQIFVSGAKGEPSGDHAAQCRPFGTSSTTAGFPLPGWGLPSIRTMRVAVLFMDFPDAPANHSTHEEATVGLPYLESYLETVSYGKLDVELVAHHEWLRAEHEHYNSVIAATGRIGISRDASLHAIELAGDQVDFSNIDVVLTVFPSTHFFSGVHLGTAVTQDGRTLSLASVGNVKRPEPGGLFAWGFNAAHELMHAVGLTDLYPFDASLHEATGAAPRGKSRVDVWWGLMLMRSWFFADSTDSRLRHTWRHGDGQTTSGYGNNLDIAEMLAWSRWQLGWLTESQVRCINEPAATVTLSPVAQPGNGVAMAAVPLNSHEVIVIESRRMLGFDRGVRFTAPEGATTTLPALITEGVLVYTVDSVIRGGHLPLKVAGDSGNGRVDDFPVLHLGDSVTVAGYTITVAADDGDTHTVTITR